MAKIAQQSPGISSNSTDSDMNSTSELSWRKLKRTPLDKVLSISPKGAESRPHVTFLRLIQGKKKDRKGTSAF